MRSKMAIFTVDSAEFLPIMEMKSWCAALPASLGAFPALRQLFIHFHSRRMTVLPDSSFSHF
jgi:hypothetical protein